MATMAMSPVEILPRPSQLRGRAGATSQASPPRIHRAGPLVFVNSSDLNTDSEKLINRKMVKKWAMLNRVRLSPMAFPGIPTPFAPRSIY